MVSDAEEAGVKVGATRASIRALLGEPDGSDPTGDVWTLGRAGYAPDYESLNIDYDNNQIAVNYLLRALELAKLIFRIILMVFAPISLITL